VEILLTEAIARLLLTSFTLVVLVCSLVFAKNVLSIILSVRNLTYTTSTAGQLLHSTQPYTLNMAASTASTTKTLKPDAIEIPPSTAGTSKAEDEFDAPISPRSWRHRTVTYQVPSRRQTNGSWDAEDYFVCGSVLRPCNLLTAI